MTKKIEFTCNKCRATTAEPTDTTPDGWHLVTDVQLTSPHLINTILHLCPPCGNRFRDWLEGKE